MLISEISNEFELKINAMESKYKRQFEEQANNEKKLKSEMETLQKQVETLEQDRQYERQLRLKLEEEFS